MNLLKEIEITGQVRSVYAVLTARYDFVDPTDQALSPCYLFPLPEGAAVTGFQMLTQEKTLIRAKMVPASQNGTTHSGYQLTRLESGIYCLSWKGLPAGEACTLIVSYVLLMPQENDMVRLTLPFAFWMPLLQPLRQNACAVSVRLDLDGVTVLGKDGRKNDVFVYRAEAAEDLVLQCSVKERKSWGYVHEEFGKGYGLYRLYTDQKEAYQKPTYDRVQLMLDISGGLRMETAEQIKKLWYDIFLRLADTPSLELYATDGTYTQDVKTEADGFAWLYARESGGSLPTMLEAAAQTQTSRTLSVLVSGTAMLYPEQLLTHIVACEPIHLFFVGKNSVCPLVQYWHEKDLGRCFCMDEKGEKKLDGHLDTIRYDARGETVTAHRAAVRETLLPSHGSLAADGYRDILISYSGQAPKEFVLMLDGTPIETVTLQPEIREFFPDVMQLYAAEKSRALRRLLRKTGLSSVRSIKKELEKLGERYGVLNEETALVMTSDTQPKGEAVVFCTAVSDGIVSTQENHFFLREGDRPSVRLSKSQMTACCRYTLLQNIRSDGGIYSPCAEKSVRSEETAMAVLALRCGAYDASLEPMLSEAENTMDAESVGFWQQALQSWKKGRLSVSSLCKQIAPPDAIWTAYLSQPNVRHAAQWLLYLSI